MLSSFIHGKILSLCRLKERTCLCERSFLVWLFFCVSCYPVKSYRRVPPVCFREVSPLTGVKRYSRNIRTQALVTGRLLISIFFRRHSAAVLLRSLSGFNPSLLTVPGSKPADIPVSIITGYNRPHTGLCCRMSTPVFPDGRGQGTISIRFGK